MLYTEERKLLVQRSRGDRVMAIHVNRDLSNEAAQLVEGLAQNSWRNAWCALEWMPDLAAGEYVEGYAIMSGSHVVFEHGWVELDGQVIDPSYPDGQVAYFPGLRFDRAAAQQAVIDDLDLPVLWRCDADQYVACMLAHVTAWDYVITRWPDRADQTVIDHINKMRAIYSSDQ